MSAPPLPPEPPSAVFRDRSAAAPQVRQPDSPWSLALGLAGALALGVIVFGTLSAGRQAHAGAQAEPKANAKDEAAPSPPAAITPPLSRAAYPGPPPSFTPQPLPAAGDAESRRLHAPVMIVEAGDAAPLAPTAPKAAESARPADDGGGSAEERFASRVGGGGVITARATRLHDLARIVPQGTVIRAVLETAINSDLPGSARAIVSRDVHGFDGAQVLIPRGSMLIGQYRNGVAYGQDRAFVIWSRILTPEGLSIEIGSPGADPLGRGGLAGETDSHFFQRFGGSILLSVLSAGVAAAGANNASTAIVIGSPMQAQSLAASAPQKQDLPVTVKVMQGAPMSVFLTRDLDFSGVIPAAK